MGFMKNMFANLQEEVGGNSVSTSQSSGKATRRASGPPPTRWEKAVVSMDKIVVQVVKVDPDGVDIVCFGGDDDADWYRNIKKTKHIEAMVNDKRPSGVSSHYFVSYCIVFLSFCFIPIFKIVANFSHTCSSTFSAIFFLSLSQTHTHTHTHTPTHTHTVKQTKTTAMSYGSSNG